MRTTTWRLDPRFRLIASLALLLTVSFPTVASAQILQDLRAGVRRVSDVLFGQGFATGNDPLQLSIETPKHGAPLDPTKFYLVKMTCSAQVNSSDVISQGLALKDYRFVAHTLWLSSAVGATDGSVPTSPVKLVNVFSFVKTSSGTIVNNRNSACTQTFLLSGQDSVLTVSFSISDTKTLATGAQVLYSALKAVAGVVPIFRAGALATTVANVAKGVGATQDPVKEIIAAINDNPRKAAVSLRLLAGREPTKISTKYSDVTLEVSPVNDLAEQISKSDDLRMSFYDVLDGISANYLKGISPSSLTARCAGFANTLANDYTFSRKDDSFIIGYFATSAYPGDIDKRLTCIGNRFNAADIVAYNFVYNRPVGARRAITRGDIDNYFADNGFNRVMLSKSVARNYTERLSNLLSIHAQTPSAQNASVKNALLRWIGSKSIIVDDLTVTMSYEVEPMDPATFISKLESQGLKRFGCFWLKPTIGAGAYDAILLAMPLVPKAGPNASFDVAEIEGIRLSLSGTGRSAHPAALREVQVTRLRSAILEAAKENDGNCGHGATISLPKLGPTVAATQSGHEASTAFPEPRTFLLASR